MDWNAQEDSKLSHYQLRLLILAGVFLVMFIVLLVAAANLQLVQGESLYQKSLDAKTRTIVLKGARGMILDRNGLVLAQDISSYNVEFYRNPSKTKEKDYTAYTQTLMTAIDIIEKNGGKIEENFAIRRDENGEMIFYFGNVSEEVYQKRLEKWKENMFIKKANRKDPPAAIYSLLCQRYAIPQDMPYEQAVKLLGIWQEVTMASYMAYVPVTIAYNVSFETVTQIAAMAAELDGISIGESTRRFYPRGASAAHVIGYTGRISDSELLAKYTDSTGIYRYAATDMVGITGIEATMEDELSGNLYARQGYKVVEINSLGNITSVISTKPATDGNNVVLTIDADLQRVVEDALAKNVAATRKYQENRYASNKAYYDGLVEKRGYDISYAEMGACVVMDVRTGEVLALANYPSYDLNQFVGGISAEEYDKLLNDPGMPLFNKAIASRAHPGSIFKMIPGFAALMEGATTLDETISDEGEYRKHLSSETAKGPRCWIRYGYEQHADQDVIKALKNSCNYYFYEMGYRMGIEKLYNWAARFGLTTLTNIELPGEMQSQVACQKTLYDLDKPASEQTSNDAKLIYRKLCDYLTGIFDEMGVPVEQTRITDAVSIMMQAAVSTSGNHGAVVRDVLINTLGLPRAVMTAKQVDSTINEYLYQILWTANRTLVASIGQDLTMITPIAAARYVSAVANGGLVYDAHIVRQVVSPSGRIISETRPKLVDDLGLKQEYVEAVHEGMLEVVSGEDGTATNAFAGSAYAHEIAGKTGTAQVSDIDIEQNAWFVAYAPLESPEIAVVVYIPQGSSGANSTVAARDIFEYWLGNRDRDNTQTLPPVNGIDS
nr:penicillin-binding transpeptidase domain-containing protein [bacterium]